MWEPSNELETQRLEKLKRLQEAGIDPYPPRAERTHTIAEAVRLYEEAEAAAGENGTIDPIPVTVCGRVRAHRPQGKSSWGDIEDGTGIVQIWVKLDKTGEEALDLYKKEVDLFDYLQVTGTMMRTRRGEVTVQATDVKILSKALSPLPVVKERKLDDGTVERYGGLNDPETRYRERYADLAVNPEVREVFLARAQTIKALRTFLDEQGFLEVETPVLQPIYGGAAARPFVTHHNFLKQDLYLRISFELYLKRLLVGGFDAVYEIGRDFRNEGVSRKHNPEFTQVEFYKAYADYEEVMALTEAMLATVAEEVTGSTQVETVDAEMEPVTIDFTPPFERLSLREAIKERAGIDYAEHPDAESLTEAMRAKGISVEHGTSWGKLVDDLLSTFVEPHLMQPTFLIDYPRDISPLAKAKLGDPSHVERFELFVAGYELANAFTELNDPLDQEQRFVDMGRMYDADSDEYQPIDEDYLRAMRYGMPPNGGFGMGVDRLVMILTGRPNIREVVLFPALRPIDEG